MKQTKINVVLYTRTAVKNDGKKLDAQEESLRKYCTLKGYNIVRVYRENGVAGLDFNRPAWSKLDSYVKMNKKRIHKVLFTRWDRLSRRVENTLKALNKYERRGIDLNAPEQYLTVSNLHNKLLHILCITGCEVSTNNKK
jgi:site-specific DNA recombinase